MKRHVLVVAVSCYADPAVLSLPGVREDGKRLQSTLGTYASDAVVLPLTDRYTTKDGIRQALADITRKAEETDQVIVYLGGHDAMNEDAAGRVQYSFLPHDATEIPLQHALSATDLSTSLSAVLADEIVVILDFCYGGWAADGGWVSDLTTQVSKNCLRPVYVMAAARPDQKAHETDSGSIFLEALCDALSCKDVVPSPDGKVSAQMAWARAADVTAHVAKTLGVEQASVQAGYAQPIYMTRCGGSRSMERLLRFLAVASAGVGLVVAFWWTTAPRIQIGGLHLFSYAVALAVAGGAMWAGAKHVCEKYGLISRSGDFGGRREPHGIAALMWASLSNAPVVLAWCLLSGQDAAVGLAAVAGLSVGAWTFYDAPIARRTGIRDYIETRWLSAFSREMFLAAAWSGVLAAACAIGLTVTQELLGVTSLGSLSLLMWTATFVGFVSGSTTIAVLLYLVVFTPDRASEDLRGIWAGLVLRCSLFLAFFLT